MLQWGLSLVLLNRYLTVHNVKGRKSTERFPTFSVIFSHPHTQFSNQKYIAVYEAKEQIQCPYINL